MKNYSTKTQKKKKVLSHAQSAPEKLTLLFGGHALQNYLKHELRQINKM